MADPASEHDAAARAGVADQPRHTAQAVRRVLDARRAPRRERHARDYLAPGTDSREAGVLARLSGLRDLEAAGPDGQDTRRRESLPRSAGAARDGAGARRSRRPADADRPAARQLHAGTVGLVAVFRAGAKSEIQPQRIGDQAVLRVEP